MGTRWIAIGAVSGAVTVALGALGAHALERRLEPRQLEVWQTAVHYQGLHALALVAFGLLLERRPRGGAAAGWAFLAGTLLFSGTLYLWALGGPGWLVHLTPVGGILFVVGWLLLAAAALRSPAAGAPTSPGGIP